MLSDALAASLDEAWGPARRVGALGKASIEELWEHTAGFTLAVCSTFGADCSTWNGRILDAGSGPGIPGVLLACQLPMAELVLVDSSDRRLDHARAAVRALELGDRVRVVHGRLDELAHESTYRSSYEVVVARLLAEPAETAELVLPCVAPGGAAIVSCRQDQTAEWHRLGENIAGVEAATITSGARGTFVTVAVTDELPRSYPRRSAVRARKPLA